MKLVKLSDLFDIKYGVNLELNSLNFDAKGIPFVSRISKNNGVSSYVKLINGIPPNPANTISVAVSGSVCEAFLQKLPYYSGYHLFYMAPKLELTESEMLLYCSLIRANKYRYSYGRQANKTLADIKIPSLEEVRNLLPKFIVKKPSKNPYHYKQVSLNDRKWKCFSYDQIFIILKGYYNKKPEDVINGDIPFIGATDKNNGVTSKHDLHTIEISSKNAINNHHDMSKKIFKGGEYITISNDGSVGYAFYQPGNFTCSHSVNPIKLKDKNLNPYIAMFLCTVIGLEQFRWSYGRKWRPVRMPKSIIKLPVNVKGKPDWKFMEYYIKSLPYSCNLKMDERKNTKNS